MTTIIGIDLLPINPFAGTENVAVIITNSVPSYFKVTGFDLDKILKVSWYPAIPSSLEFEIRQLILADSTATKATFMIRVVDNFLNTIDRAGKISFQLTNGSTLVFPVKTFGPVTLGSLWQSPYEGLSTG